MQSEFTGGGIPAPSVTTSGLENFHPLVITVKAARGGREVAGHLHDLAFFQAMGINAIAILRH